MPETPSSSFAQGHSRRAGVEIDRREGKVKVTLSLTNADRPNRKKVLERARRMLATALEQERREAGPSEESKSAKSTPSSPAPGNGAWWLF